MDDPEIAEAIANSFLGSLPPEVVDEILTDAGRTDYPAGTTVYRGGSPPRAALVIHGLLRVYMASPEGRQITVRYARDSDVLGIAVVVGGPFNVDAQTLAPSSVLDLSARALTGVAQRDARVAWALAEELDRRLYDTLQQAAINAFGSVKQRVAGHLLDLASDQQLRTAASWRRCRSRNSPIPSDRSARSWPGCSASSGWPASWRPRRTASSSRSRRAPPGIGERHPGVTSVTRTRDRSH